MDFKKNLTLIFTILIVVAFFLPWVSAESEAVGGIAKVLTGKKQSAIASVSGFKVPILANSEESRFMITIIKIFQPNIKNADKKSYLIWVVPLLAIGMFLVNHFCKDQKWIKLGTGIIGCAIFAVATFKVSTTDLNKLVMKVTIEYGLWLILAGYLGIGVLNLLDFLRLNKK